VKDNFTVPRRTQAKVPKLATPAQSGVRGVEATCDVPKHRQRRKSFRNRPTAKYASIPWFEKANRFHCSVRRK
jgi:hypothetical protein